MAEVRKHMVTAVMGEIVGHTALVQSNLGHVLSHRNAFLILFT